MFGVFIHEEPFEATAYCFVSGDIDMTCAHYIYGFYNLDDDLSFGIMLERIFDLHAEETISDEQIIRVLEPILTMIEGGLFSKPSDSVVH